MTYQLERYENYSRGVRRMLLCAGLWPGHVSSKYFRYIAFIHVVTSIIASLGIIYFVLSHKTNVSLVTKGLGVTLSFITTILKVTILLLDHDYLVELHETLETTFQIDLAEPELRPIVLSTLKFFYHPTFWLSLSTWGLIFIYVTTPMISVFVQRIRGITPINYHTPFPTKYPWTVVGNSILYPTHYFIELGAGFAAASVTASTDALFGYYIFQIASQLRTLSHRMTNIKEKDDYQPILKYCIRRHQILTKCRDKLGSIYGPIILWLLGTSALTICSNIFQASQMSWDKGILVLAYIIAKLLQTLLYAWYGMFLTAESEAFRESVYFTGWPLTNDKPFLSNIRMLLMCKPLVLTACHYFVVSLDMFMGISNTAISYFFLLRTIDGKKA